MPTHTVTMSFKNDAGSVPIGGTSYFVPNEVNAFLKVPAGSVNLSFALEFLFAKVNDYCLSLGSQTPAQALAGTFSEATVGSMLVNVNSSGSPAPAITVNAKQPQVYAACVPGTTNLFSANVTAFLCNNSGSSDLVLVVKVGLNT